MDPQKEALQRIIMTLASKNEELNCFLDSLRCSLRSVETNGDRLLSELEEEFDSLAAALGETRENMKTKIRLEQASKTMDLDVRDRVQSISFISHLVPLSSLNIIAVSVCQFKYLPICFHQFEWALLQSFCAVLNTCLFFFLLSVSSSTAWHFFVYSIEAHGGVRIKRIVQRRGTQTAEMRVKIVGDLHKYGTWVRMTAKRGHAVNKMDAATISQSQKWRENWKC
uniref:Uncharacterized protein n=1 Tax=Eptatretus burgeri TaxID=7764 RepID=A0A8C4QTK7_EPTBU